MMCLTAGRASLECQKSSTSGHAATSLLEWYRFGIVFINQKTRGADSVRLGSYMAATGTDIFVLSCTKLITCSKGIVFLRNGIVFLQKRPNQTYFYHDYTFISFIIERRTNILYSFFDICFIFPKCSIFEYPGYSTMSLCGYRFCLFFVQI